VQSSEEWTINEKNAEGVENLKGKKIWTISRFVRVILAQGPC